ncbi:MAG: DUF4142 domain-containing protein [Armatimonadetes bacterium]|nr:DUF4142 domain-containing protein [Armatimonadota bacterium]
MHTRYPLGALLAALALLISFGTADAARRSSVRRAGAPDRTFMVKAAHINIGEVQAGQLALTRAVNAHVRDYAQMMITDHSRANMALKRVAANERVNLPNNTDHKHRALANRLAKLSGADFDRAFMNAMVKGHQDAIRLFENHAARSGDYQVRAYAMQTLPTLRTHLNAARRLANTEAVRTGTKSPPGANFGIDRGGNNGGNPGAPRGQDSEGAGAAADGHEGHDH